MLWVSENNNILIGIVLETIDDKGVDGCAKSYHPLSLRMNLIIA